MSETIQLTPSELKDAICEIIYYRPVYADILRLADKMKTDEATARLLWKDCDDWTLRRKGEWFFLGFYGAGMTTQGFVPPTRFERAVIGEENLPLLFMVCWFERRTGKRVELIQEVPDADKNP